MFRSKLQDRIITQYEHGRLSGLLAYYWGNASFEKPPIDFMSFVKGVTTHDRGYGVLDNAGIGEALIEEWLSIQQRGIDLQDRDPVADIIALTHIQRLLHGENTPERNALAQQAQSRIDERLSEIDHTPKQFKWIDRVTNFCDMISFDFCFDNLTERTLQLPTKVESEETIPVTYSIQSEGIITVSPWPFAIEDYSGFILGYRGEGFPDDLQPMIVPFEVIQQ